MITLTRKAGESIQLTVNNNCDPNITVQELFGSNNITITLHHIHETDGVRIGVEAPNGIIAIPTDLLDSARAE